MLFHLHSHTSHTMSKTSKINERIQKILKHYPDEVKNFLNKCEKQLHVDTTETPLWDKLYKDVKKFQTKDLTEEACKEVLNAFNPIIQYLLKKRTKENDAFYTLFVMAVCNHIELDFDPQYPQDYRDDENKKKVANVYWDILELFHLSNLYDYPDWNFRSDQCNFYYQHLFNVSEDLDYQKKIDDYFQHLF